MRYSIELDCAPGGIRPRDLLPAILKDTGIKLNKPNSTFFGNWTWTIPDDQTKQYESARNTIKNRIIALYHNGTIRYGSW